MGRCVYKRRAQPQVVEMMSQNLVLLSLSLLLTEDPLCVRPIGWHVNRLPPLPCSRLTGLGVGISLDSASEAALSPPPLSHSFLGLQGSRERVECNGVLVVPPVFPGP